MCREIFLLITHSRLFPAHWALWVPNPSHPSPETGKIINVRGDAMTGFRHEFDRGTVLEPSAATSLVPLGEVKERWELTR